METPRKSILVAGVNIDPNNKPKKDDLIKLAKISKQHESNPNADRDIQKEIEKSGLYPGVTAAVNPSKLGGKS